MEMSHRYGRIIDEALAELRARIGVPIPRREAYLETATKDAIRHFAMGLGDTDPTLDRWKPMPRGRAGRIIASPCLLSGMDAVSSGMVGGLPAYMPCCPGPIESGTALCTLGNACLRATPSAMSSKKWKTLRPARSDKDIARCSAPKEGGRRHSHSLLPVQRARHSAGAGPIRRHRPAALYLRGWPFTLPRSAGPPL
jgi:hypothetical protein